MKTTLCKLKFSYRTWKEFCFRLTIVVVFYFYFLHLYLHICIITAYKCLINEINNFLNKSVQAVLSIMCIHTGHTGSYNGISTLTLLVLLFLVLTIPQTCKYGHYHLVFHLHHILGQGINWSTNFSCHGHSILSIW